MDHTSTMDADEWGIEEARMVPVGDDWQGGQWQTPQTLIDFEEFPTPNHHHLIPDPTRGSDRPRRKTMRRHHDPEG